jgi:hypothetical protein
VGLGWQWCWAAGKEKGKRWARERGQGRERAQERGLGFSFLFLFKPFENKLFSVLNLEQKVRGRSKISFSSITLFLTKTKHFIFKIIFVGKT